MAGTSSSRSSPTPNDRRLAVARIVGAKGLGGAVRVEPLTDWPDRLTTGADLWLEGADAPIRVTGIETGGRSTVLRLEGIVDRSAAEGLVGRYLEVTARELPDDEYYWDELVGLRVEEPDGTPIGELVEVFRAGGAEVYRVVGDGGERLVPALRSAVLRIDLEANMMVIAPDESEEVR
jgi:16S rRNA processing protein RimM